MQCHEVRELLNPYSDGELDLFRQVEIEKHLGGCAACAEQEQNLRSLRNVISSPSLYYQAPDSLRNQVQRAIPRATSRQRRTLMRASSIAAGVLLMIGAAVTIRAFVSQGGLSDEHRLAECVVADHVRSVQVDHLMDVASTDRHTVKPWFQGKLDFSPQVPDLSAKGYPLAGGRLDYLADRPVAALVYQRRLHLINLFTWPAVNDEGKATQTLSRQGFHLCHWQRSGMTYWAISDLNAQELNEFAQLYQDYLTHPPQ